MNQKFKCLCVKKNVSSEVLRIHALLTPIFVMSFGKKKLYQKNETLKLFFLLYIFYGYAIFSSNFKKFLSDVINEK